MRVSIQEVCKFAETNPSCKSFVGGEALLNAGHLIHCGKLSNDDCLNGQNYKIFAFCLQTSHLRDAPHEMTGEIQEDGQVIKMKCSCKAGLSGACKHVVAVLLHCNR